MTKKVASTSSALKVSKAVRAALDNVKAEGRTVQVLGRVKDGKLEIDHTSLTELVKKFPDSAISFVAVNAPFDPRPLAA